VYKKRSYDWSKFEVDKFCPHLFTFSSSGCGSNALALLTGVNPHTIINTNHKNYNDWKDSFMVSFLKKRGFKIKPLTKCDVSNITSDSIYTSEPISDRHVILMSQLMTKNGASWSVVHNKLWYHNFQTCSYTGLNIINYPTLTCYVVSHPSWKLPIKFV
jgi:hypothetical protein